MSAMNEESELAMVKGLRSGKITIQTDDENDSTLDVCVDPYQANNVNNTLQNFMDERDRVHQIRPSSPISPKSYIDNTKERLSFVEEVVNTP